MISTTIAHEWTGGRSTISRGSGHFGIFFEPLLLFGGFDNDSNINMTRIVSPNKIIMNPSITSHVNKF
jgi:hypothetical protein